MLTRPIEIHEVEEEMHQMMVGKATGPDGFTSNLFRYFWDLIKMEVGKIVEESCQDQGVLSAFYASFLNLIPESKGVDTPSKFRPIAVFNVIIYKIISKLVTNRLKHILSLLIGPDQSRFVEAIQILDGIIIFHDGIYSLKITKKLGMLVKLDIAKAYDKLIWQYMREILRAFGFGRDTG